MSRKEFEAAAEAAVAVLGPSRTKDLAGLFARDRGLEFLGSANLTESGVRRNLEAGVLVRGGTAPRRAAEHVRELQRRGFLRPLGP